jgi:DNA-binding Lrp family transcriptional regulator
MKGEKIEELQLGPSASDDPPNVRACVLVRVRSGQHFQVAKEIARIPGIKTAFAVMGAADVVARIEVTDMKALVALGTKIGNLEDVVTTETLVVAEV